MLRVTVGCDSDGVSSPCRPQDCSCIYGTPSWLSLAPRLLSLQGPAHVLAHDGGRVAGARSECRDDARTRRRITESDCDVAQPALVTGTTKRRPFGAIAPFVLRPTEEH